MPARARGSILRIGRGAHAHDDRARSATVVVYGPRSAWPRADPWNCMGSQAAGHVRLIPGNAPRAPGFKEGCQRNVASFSDCLHMCPAGTAVEAVEAILHPERIPALAVSRREFACGTSRLSSRRSKDIQAIATAWFRASAAQPPARKSISGARRVRRTSISGRA